MNIFTWIIFGGIAGFIASLLTQSNHGAVTDILLGIVGAFVGGIIMSLIGFGSVSGFNVYSLVVAIIGSIILISLGKLLEKKY